MDESQNNSSGPQRDYFLPISILVAGVMVSGSILYLVGNKNIAPAPALLGNNLPSPTAAAPDLTLSPRDVILIDPKAPVTVVEYGDYQCPYCGKFFSQIELPLRDEYIKTGKVKMIFRNFPFLGPESTAAANAAECAKDQKQFWAYHDSLYTTEIKDGHENNGNLTRALFIKLASDLKMDTAVFTTCIDTNKYAGQVSDDYTKAQGMGVNSTPTTFVNDQKVTGAVPYADFKAAIDTALKVK